MNFSGWWKSYRANKAIKPYIWLCGTEQVLKDEILDIVKSILDVEPWNYFAFDPEIESERVLWSILDQHAINEDDRLVVVRHAQRIQSVDRLAGFFQAKLINSHTHVVFVSDAPDYPKDEPHIQALRTRGSIVECNPFTQSTVPVAVDWVRSKIDVTVQLAGHLLNRSNGNIRLVRDICVKLAQVPDSVSMSSINALLSESPRDTLSEALLALDKPSALLALSSVSENDIGMLLGQLEDQLAFASMLHDKQAARAEDNEIRRAAGRRAFLIPMFKKVSKHYDKEHRAKIRNILVQVDDAYFSGNRVGILESVIQFW